MTDNTELSKYFLKSTVSWIFVKRYNGRNVVVEVKRHTDNYSTYMPGPWRWCLYALINDGLPIFEASKQEAFFNSAPFHGGVSLHETEQTIAHGSKYQVIRVGADYGHLYDERFTLQETLTPNCEIVRDAEAMLQWLVARCEAWVVNK